MGCNKLQWSTGPRRKENGENREFGSSFFRAGKIQGTYRTIITVCNSSCGKVMFLHMSVIVFTGGVVYLGRPPGQTAPLGRHLPPRDSHCILVKTVFTQRSYLQHIENFLCRSENSEAYFKREKKPQPKYVMTKSGRSLTPRTALLIKLSSSSSSSARNKVNEPQVVNLQGDVLLK